MSQSGQPTETLQQSLLPKNPSFFGENPAVGGCSHTLLPPPQSSYFISGCMASCQRVHLCPLVMNVREDGALSFSFEFLFLNKFICIFFSDTTYNRYHIILAFAWLTSLSMIISRSIHLLQMTSLCSFLQLSNKYSIVYINTVYITDSWMVEK